MTTMALTERYQSDVRSWKTAHTLGMIDSSQLDEEIAKLDAKLFEDLYSLGEYDSIDEPVTFNHAERLA